MAHWLLNRLRPLAIASATAGTGFLRSRADAGMRSGFARRAEASSEGASDSSCKAECRIAGIEKPITVMRKRNDRMEYRAPVFMARPPV